MCKRWKQDSYGGSEIVTKNASWGRKWRIWGRKTGFGDKKGGFSPFFVTKTMAFSGDFFVGQE